MLYCLQARASANGKLLLLLLLSSAAATAVGCHPKKALATVCRDDVRHLKSPKMD